MNIHALVSDQHGTQEIFECRHVVLAVPPRLVSSTIEYQPSLSGEQIEAMNRIPTWMAGHAKLLACYDKPFWRDAGLSGDAMSRRGPLVEIHDASPSKGGPYALFGFLGVSTLARASQRQAVLDAAIDQLAQLFGPQAKNPIGVQLQDWAFEIETATSLDHIPLNHHPAYGLPQALSKLWDGRLILSSTEVAHDFGGYLEGALEAAQAALAQIVA